jgi:hypothetical protein
MKKYFYITDGINIMIYNSEKSRDAELVNYPEPCLTNGPFSSIKEARKEALNYCTVITF